MTTNISQHSRNSISVSAIGDATATSRATAKQKRRALSTTSAISAPSSIEGPDTRKLRASCDGCYLAKIKCGKERPKCRRCSSHGTSCSYSPSQRIGKPRRLALPTSASPPKHSQPVIEAGSEKALRQCLGPLHHEPGHLNNETADSSSDTGDVGTPSLEWPFHLTPATSGTNGSETTLPVTPSLSHIWQQALYDLPQQDPLAFNAADIPHLSLSGFDAPHAWSQSPSPLATSAPSVLQQQHTPSMTHAHTQQPTPMTPSMRAPPSSPPRQQSCSCDVTTFDILRTLHDRSSSHPTPYDTILTTNKDVLARITNLLTCTLCEAAMDATLVLTLAAVITRMLTSYASAVTHGVGAKDAAPEHRHLDTGNARGSFSALPPHTPIVLGVYRLDGEDEELVKMHVVLNELRKVDALLVRFGDRFRTMSLSHTAHNTITVGDGAERTKVDIEAAFYENVVGFLRKKLRKVVEVLQRQLRVDFSNME